MSDRGGPVAVAAVAFLALVGLGGLAARWWSMAETRTGAEPPPEDGAEGSTERQDGLEGLDPAFRLQLEAVLGRLEARGYAPWIYETLRTQERQSWLYASGRTREGTRVTNVETVGNHGRGMAADVIDGRPHPTRAGQRIGWGTWEGDPGDAQAAEMAEEFFAALGEEAEAEGLVWGGRWTLSGGGADQPHVELA